MTTLRMQPVHIVGGGLAGSEAAWQIASRGVPVVLHEMRPVRVTAAHQTEALAELVCSNSFRSDDRETNAVGLLHEEMRRLGSLIMRERRRATRSRPAARWRSTAMAFAAAVTAALEAHPLIEIRREEIACPAGRIGIRVIVATGPLTSPALADGIRALTGEADLAFFDAIAPIVHRDSIDMSVAWFQSRYDKAGPGGSGADYINCPLTREQYDAFVDALLAGDKISFHEWEANTPYFDGCLPIEVMAERGRETAAPRPDEAVRPDQSARSDGESLRDRAAAPGQQARHAVQHGRLPDQAEARRAGAHLPHHPGTGERRVRAPRRPAPQHLSQFAEAARRRRCGSTRRRACALPARSPAARAMSNPPRSACSPAASRPPSGSASRSRCRRRPRRTARCSATSPAATSRRSMPGRARSSR